MPWTRDEPDEPDESPAIEPPPVEPVGDDPTVLCTPPGYVLRVPLGHDLIEITAAGTVVEAADLDAVHAAAAAARITLGEHRA